MTENDEQLAARLADAAGRILLDLRAAGDLAGKALGQAGDEAANAMLCRELRAARPDDALLAFLQSTYEAAATLGKWDRPALERTVPSS